MAARRHAHTWPTTPAAEAIYMRDGRPYRVGELLVQADYARTLERLAAHGADDFYHGELAETIAPRHGDTWGALHPGGSGHLPGADQRACDRVTTCGYTVLSDRPARVRRPCWSNC